MSHPFETTRFLGFQTVFIGVGTAFRKVVFTRDRVFTWVGCFICWFRPFFSAICVRIATFCRCKWLRYSPADCKVNATFPHAGLSAACERLHWTPVRKLFLTTWLPVTQLHHPFPTLVHSGLSALDLILDFAFWESQLKLWVGKWVFLPVQAFKSKCGCLSWPFRFAELFRWLRGTFLNFV